MTILGPVLAAVGAGAGFLTTIAAITVAVRVLMA